MYGGSKWEVWRIREKYCSVWTIGMEGVKDNLKYAK
jgi:hypothetical protein